MTLIARSAEKRASKNPNATRGMVSMQPTAVDTCEQNQTPFLADTFPNMECQSFSGDGVTKMANKRQNKMNAKAKVGQADLG